MKTTRILCIGIMLLLNIAFIPAMQSAEASRNVIDSEKTDFETYSTFSPRSTTIETDREFDRYYEDSVLNYLVKNADGTITNVDCRGEIKVITSDNKGKTLWKKTVPHEFGTFGGFFSGEKYNFIVFGSSTNPEKNPDGEVLRIVKYNKKFKKLGSVSISAKDADAQSAIWSGCARFAENGDTLVLHTARKKFNGHQANLTITINTDKMKVTSIDKAEFQYVSHSFDQFVIFDQYDNKFFPVYLDLGDGYPRAVVLHQATPEELDLPFMEYIDGHGTILYDIPGEIGDNYTGVQIVGFQASTSNYLTVIYKDKSLILYVTPKDFTQETKSKEIVLAKNVLAAYFNILSNGDNTFTVAWHETTNTKSSLGYYDWHVAQLIDGEGNLKGKQKRYEDAYDFYAEFLGVSALPDAELIAKLPPAEEEKEYCTVVYYTQLDNKYKSLINYTGATVEKGSKLKAPKEPKKKGYTFVGWYDDPNPKYAKKWDFKKDKVTENMILVARFKKNK